MIQFKKVSKHFNGDHQALDGLSFSVAAGELVFITGHSGAGKTTLLKLISLIERPSVGQIWVDGRHLAEVQRLALPYYRRQIGIVFQDHRLLMDRSLSANVALPLVIQGYHQKDMKRPVQAALDKVGLLTRAQVMPHELSAGEQQRVGLARAVVNRPRVLLADEPTGNLDPNLSKDVMQLFERFSQMGTTVLIATHDLDLVRRLGHRQLALSRGQLQLGASY